MSNKKVRGKNKVQKKKLVKKKSWLTKEQYKVGLDKGLTEYAAKSKLCKKEVYVDNMGKSALNSHMSTVKHSQLGDECTEAINNL